MGIQSDQIGRNSANVLKALLAGIPMSTNCAPLFADLFLHVYSYEAEFVQKLLQDNNKKTSRVHQQHI
jgi:hypothetical protein